MKYILLLLSIILFTACNKLKKETLIIEETIDSTIQKKEPIIEEEKVPEIIFQDTTSHIKSYQIKLENSKYNFIVKNLDDIEFSRINLLGTDERFHYIQKELKNEILEICNHVQQINSFKFKGQVEISRNTFPRGTLTEYIFPNEILASQAFQNLQDFKRRNRSYWEMKVDVKCPSTMILRDNRLYHVITGGWFMMGKEEEIATILFD
ncbi:hypothetical protein BST92_00245 [Nonlabens arenilitoris]|uniref:Lipoprotein n=1 Tax=Nonlabens arenilitoris TaxID=1217969 RepID=A0A2S7U853_9FLAO|nr:hypothetical protein [Nonlabens arenilitoris]PQJ30463.1 hypothetical protein BST92_00245 [Nonlabens arenilitoris]